jgi:hypothetical protein
LPELVQFISEDKPLTIAQTAGGIKVVFEVTPEFGSTPETAVFMEAEEVAGGSAKVASGAPAAESVQQKIAQVEPMQPGIAQAETINLQNDAVQHPYTGDLVKVPKVDPQAEKLLAQRVITPLPCKGLDGCEQSQRLRLKIYSTL